VAGAADLKKDLALAFELDFLVVQPPRQKHRAVNGEQRGAIQAVKKLGLLSVEDGLHPTGDYTAISCRLSAVRSKVAS
jgi:hypothetical protein